VPHYPFPSPAPEAPGGGSALGSHSITLEEFQHKIVYERWTGNLACPAGSPSAALLYPVTDCPGEDISMSKPAAWLAAQQQSRQKAKQVRLCYAMPYHTVPWYANPNSRINVYTPCTTDGPNADELDAAPGRRHVPVLRRLPAQSAPVPRRAPRGPRGHGGQLPRRGLQVCVCVCLCLCLSFCVCMLCLFVCVWVCLYLCVVCLRVCLVYVCVSVYAYACVCMCVCYDL
jgi:hypothetical protein